MSMKQQFHPLENIDDFWRISCTSLEVPIELQQIWQELHMTPTGFVELWKTRCMLGEGFAECFHPHKERTWSIGEEGQNHIHNHTNLFVLKNLQDEEFFSEVAQYFYHVTGGFISLNLYWNQTNSVAFPPHYDCHYVFVFQLYGKKSWHIAPPTLRFPTEVDLKSQPLHFPIIKSSVENKGIYIPWGFWHHAIPSVHSIHLSVGVHENALFPIKI